MIFTGGVSMVGGAPLDFGRKTNGFKLRAPLSNSWAPPCLYYSFKFAKLIFKACLPDTRQATTRLPNFFVYFILTLNFDAATQQKSRDIKELYLDNFYLFIPRSKKMLTLTTEMRQCTLDSYNIVEQSACLT